MKKVLVLALVVVGGLVIGSPRLADYFANKAFKEKNREKEWAPGLAYRGGVFHMHLYNFGKANTIFKKALDQWDDFEKRPDCMYKTASSYKHLGKTGKALKWYKRYKNHYPDHRWYSEAKKNISQLNANLEVSEEVAR